MKKISLVILIAFFLHPHADAQNVSSRDSEGLTPLHRAAGAGDTALVTKLLQQGADPLALDSKMGVSVLHKAVYSGNAATLKVLLQAGALVNLQSPSNGDTPLHDALYFRRGKDLSVIRTLLQYHPSLAIKNRAGLAPLESAKLLKADDVVQVLEKYEAERESEDSRQLMSAVRQNNLADVAKILKTAKKEILSEADDQGFTPLLWASREGEDAIVQMLLQQGADPNQNDQWMGANSGHKAAFWGRAEVMKLLVAHGLNINARGGYNGYTPLHDAVSGNHYEVAEILVRAGADLSLRGHDQKTVRDIAQENGDQKMIELLQ